MKKILICFLLLYGSISFGQITTTLSSSKNYYTYTPITVGATNITYNSATITGSNTRVKSNKNESTATKKSVQNWMVIVGVDSMQGLSVSFGLLIENTEYTYYHSILVYENSGDTAWYKGDNETFTTSDYIDETPDFVIQDKTLQQLDSEIDSEPFEVSLFDSAMASIIDGEFSVNAGAFSNTTRRIFGGDDVVIRLTSSSDCETEVTSIFIVGTVQDTFNVTTVPNAAPMFDPTDDFTPVLSALRNISYFSDSIIVGSLLCPVSLSITNSYGNPSSAYYKKGVNGNWTYADGTVSANDTLWVRITSSDQFNTAVECTLHVGDMDVWLQFMVTTDVMDNIPTPFTFTDVVNAELTTLYQDSIVISGINTDISISISGEGGAYRIGELGSWATSENTVSNGDTVWIRNTSSDLYETSINTILTVGDIPDTWTITTKAEVPDNALRLNTNEAIRLSNGEYLLLGE